MSNKKINTKYELPAFLNGKISVDQYRRWLQRKATAHVRRDRSRGNKTATVAGYKEAIHTTVNKSCGKDYYTGEKLKWDLISTYDNQKSKKDGREYKKKFYFLPSLDHVGDGKGKPDFTICAWRTNDAKNDMTYNEFVELCLKVVRMAKKNKMVE